jgi:outer membrane usher protein FimD/PapC
MSAHRRILFAAACFLLLFRAPEASAQDVGVFQFFVNLQPKGEVFVRQERDGLWIKISDLRAAGLVDLKGDTRALSGEPHMRLESIKGATMDVDDAELTVSISVDAQLLGTQTFDLRSAPVLGITPSAGNSAYLNYRIGHQAFQGSASANTLENQLNVRTGGWLFQYQDSYDSSLAENRYLRQSTNLVRDWPDRMLRLNIGDLTALSGELGSARTIGGIGIGRVFDMQPNFVSNPTARLIGQVNFQSTAEVYVDGVRVRTQNVNPGVFQFNNLDYYGGLRNTEIVIRDAYGNRQVIGRSFYFSEQILKEGLHDFSYNLGIERQDVGVRSNSYSGRAWSLYHHYGVRDWLSVGVRSDGNREAWSIGPGAGIVLGSYGVLAAGFSARRNTELGRGGNAMLARYSFDSPTWSVRAQLRDQDPGYNVAAAAPQSRALPWRDSLLGAGYNTRGWGSLSYDVTRSRMHDGAFRNADTFGYSVTMLRSLQIFVTASRVHQNTGTGWEGFAGVSMSFDEGRNASLTRQKVQGTGDIDVLEFAKSTPEGEGYGYRLGVENSPGATVFKPFGQLNTRHFTFTGDGDFRMQGDAAGPNRASVSVSGALGAVGGHFALTRPVQSSFAVVKVGELEGVRVYRNNQEIGRTGADGTLVIPNVTAYAYNSLSIAPEDVPMDYELADIEKTVVPSPGGGVLADMGLRALRAYEGKLLYRDQGASMDQIVVTLTRAGRSREVTTTYAGRFYIDDLEPGDYAASFGACRFTLTLPPAKDAVTRLPPIAVPCDAPPPPR